TARSFFSNWPMQDQHQTRDQLYEELAALRARVAELERARDSQLLDRDRPDARQHSYDSRSAPARIQQALEWHQRFFEELATGAPLSTILDILCRKVESQIDGGLCSILLLDQEGLHLTHGAAPSLPEAYLRAIDGEAIGPFGGSCGAAAYRGEPVIVADVASDPLWAEYRDLALSHDLRACWSAPFCDSQQRVLGTLAVYYRESRLPSADELEEIKQSAYLASVAVERARAEAALRSSEQCYRLVSRATNDV